MEKYDIYKVEFIYEEDLLSANPQTKERPVLVLGTDMFIPLAKITGTPSSEPKHYKINDWKEAGLDKESYIYFDKKILMSKSELIKKTYIGHLSDNDIHKIKSQKLESLRNTMKFKIRKNINEVFDNRTELIKKIDKFLYDNPEIEPPEGYVDSHSRNYDDLKSMYGDYVTTKFRYVKTSDLEDFAKTYLNESLKEDTVKQNNVWKIIDKNGTLYGELIKLTSVDIEPLLEIGSEIPLKYLIYDALPKDAKKDSAIRNQLIKKFLERRHLNIGDYFTLPQIRPSYHGSGVDYGTSIRKVNRLTEDTIKQNGKWVNKGKEGTHGKFTTKKKADAQRKAMFANGYKEGLKEGVAGLYSDTEYKNKIEHDANYMLDQLSKLDLLKEGDEHTLDSSTIKIDIKWPKGQSPTSKLYVYTNDHLNSGGTICVRNMADYRYPQRLIDDLIKNIEKIKISPFLLSESKLKEELEENLKVGDKFKSNYGDVVDIISIDKRKDGYTYVNYILHTTDASGRRLDKKHHAEEYNMFLDGLKKAKYKKIEDGYKEELKESFSEESIVRQELLDDFDLELESFWIDDDMLIFTTSEGKKYVIHNPLDLDEAELAYAVYDAVESELDESLNEDINDEFIEDIQDYLIKHGYKGFVVKYDKDKFSIRDYIIIPKTSTYNSEDEVKSLFSNLKGDKKLQLKLGITNLIKDKYNRGLLFNKGKKLSGQLEDNIDTSILKNIISNLPSDTQRILSVWDNCIRCEYSEIAPEVYREFKKASKQTGLIPVKIGTNIYFQKLDESLNEAKKKDILKAIRTTSIPEGDIFQVGDAQTGWTAQIQNHGVDELDVKHNSHKTKSGAWGRIWKNKKLVKQFDGPLNVVRDEMVKFLQSKGLTEGYSEYISESLNEDYSSKYFWPNGSPVSKDDVIDALQYMYGFGMNSIIRMLNNNDFTDDEVQRAINYFADKNESLNEASRLDVIKSNKEDYAKLENKIKSMPDGIEKDISIEMGLKWIKGNNWLGGLSDSIANKAAEKISNKYNVDIYDVFDMFEDMFIKPEMKESMNEELWDSSRVKDIAEYGWNKGMSADDTIKLVINQMKKEGSQLPKDLFKIHTLVNDYFDLFYDQENPDDWEDNYVWDESLDEASYGGAFDIEDDMFFTREEINEFAYDIADSLASDFGKKYDVAGVYMETPTDLYISIIDENGYESYNTFHIDMRKIRSPKDLNKYAEVVIDWFTKDFNKEYEWERRAYSESLNEERWEVVKDYKYQKGDELTLWWRTPSGETQYARVEYAGRDKDKNYKFISTTYGWTYLVSKDKDKVKMPNKDVWYDRISHGNNDCFPESLNEEDEYDDEFYKGDDGNFYKELKSKSVYDSDGFTTDYTLYMKVIPDGSRADVEFVTVFGDNELYRPEDGYYDFECNDFKEALEWFNNYDNEEDFDESLKEARYSDAYDDNRKKQGWWYFTTHGVQPGSIPKDLNVIEIKDGKNSKGTQGTFVKLDGILNTDELKKFDMKEEVPDNESLEEALVNPTDEDIESFEDLLNEFGFEVEGKGKTLFGNTHYQIIYPERTIDVSEIRSIATPLVDKLDVWEKDHEIPVTWNFGTNKDGYLTAGMDLNKKWIPESLNQKSSNINEELYIKEAYNDYDPEDGWTEEDIELHKSIDWKARNYEEYDAGDSVTMEVVLYGLDEPEYAKVEMHKFLRSNPIYPPYYRPVMEKPFGMDIAYVGPMYDGNDYNNYQVHDRYETQETYDMLSDSLRVEKKELSLREKLNKLDHEGLDNNNYLDLVNLYEAVNDRLNAQEKQELKKLVDTSNDPEVISSYLNAKLNKDKNKGINNENN